MYLFCVYTRTQVQPLPSALVSRSDSGGGGAKNEDDIVAPPDIFSGDTCATPTPGDFLVGGGDSGTSTPRYLDSPSAESLHTKSSPLAAFNLKADKPGNSPPSPRGSPRTSSLVQTTAASVRSHTREPDDNDRDASADLSVVSCGSPSGRMFSILTSSQHTSRPSDQSLPEQLSEEIPDYSLTSLPSTTSIGSVSNDSEVCEKD